MHETRAVLTLYSAGEMSSYNFLYSSPTCQARLNGIGSAIGALASDTTLPYLSRVTIYMELNFFYSTAYLTFPRYRWGKVLEGLRSLLDSGKLKQFELRMCERGRTMIRMKELQGTVSRIVGRTCRIEGLKCRKCSKFVRGKSTLQELDFSLVWQAGRTESLALRNSEEEIEILDAKICQKCGYTFRGGFEEDTMFVDEQPSR